MKGPRRPDRMEMQPDDFYESVIEGYRKLAASEPKRFMLIDGSDPADEIESRNLGNFNQGISRSSRDIRTSNLEHQTSEMAFSKKTAIGLLRRAHENNRLGHAYLISGPVGSGKREVAANLASVVNGTEAATYFPPRPAKFSSPSPNRSRAEY